MTLSFTRRADGYRAWFSVVRSTGQLRPGALVTEFDAIVIDPTDTTATEFFVSESISKPGLYYFDIPATYLIASGTGDYGVSVEVDITTAPKVTTAFSDVLKVSNESWDSLSSSLNSSISILSSSQITSNDVWNYQANLSNTSGTMGWLQNLIASRLSLVDYTNASGSLIDSVISGVWNANASTFDISGTMGFVQNLISIINSVTSQSFTVVNQISSSIETGIELSITSSDLLVSGVWNANASTFNTAGTMGRLQNTAGAGGVDIDLLVSGVWNAGSNAFNASGTMGWLTNKIVIMSGSLEKIRKIESGRWRIIGSQQIFYDDDGVTPILTVNLFDGNGSPFVHDNDAVVERIPV
jgi:hypothetical protein